MPAERHFLVVTGMHRSNTSLMAQVLDSVGVDFGDQLVAANRSNPYGHFENIPLLEFHEAVLRENGTSWRPWIKRDYPVPREQHSAAEEIVRRSIERNDRWGFKVPHATLLLPYWRQYENALFIFMFREPRAVLYSLLRRIGTQIYYKPYFAVNVLLTYCLYNESILDFLQREQGRVFLVHNEQLLDSPVDVLENLQQHLGIELEIGGFSSSLIDKSIAGMKHRKLARVYADALGAHPRATKVYNALLSHTRQQSELLRAAYRVRA